MVKSIRYYVCMKGCQIHIRKGMLYYPLHFNIDQGTIQIVTIIQVHPLNPQMYENILVKTSAQKIRLHWESCSMKCPTVTPMVYFPVFPKELDLNSTKSYIDIIFHFIYIPIKIRSRKWSRVHLTINKIYTSNCNSIFS